MWACRKSPSYQEDIEVEMKQIVDLREERDRAAKEKGKYRPIS